MLEKTKNDKILTRFVKKGGDVIKKLSQTILQNAAQSTRKKAESLKSALNGSDAPNGSDNTEAISKASRPESLSGVKRPRELDSAEPPPVKRTVNPTNGKSTSSKAPITTKKANSTQDNRQAASAAASSSKQKANIVAPKAPPSLFSSLMSASKKPGTSNAARAAAAAAKEKERYVTCRLALYTNLTNKHSTPTDKKDTPPPAAVAKPAFSFSETMADLNKPKEPTPTKVVEEPPETEEEKAKRLRKEERRKLRVSWKPDDSLTEVRLFTHDPDEEIGHDESMIRDVSDVGGEGRMLKLHRGLEDLDDEEDQDLNDGSMLSYTTPLGI